MIINIKDFKDKVILKDNYLSKKDRYNFHNDNLNKISYDLKAGEFEMFKNPFKLEELWDNCGNNIRIAEILKRLNFHFELENKRWVFFDNLSESVLIGKEYVYSEVFVGDTVGFIPSAYTRFDELDIESEFTVIRGSTGMDYKGFKKGKRIKNNLSFEDIFIRDSKGKEYFIGYEEIMKIKKRKCVSIK